MTHSLSNNAITYWAVRRLSSGQQKQWLLGILRHWDECGWYACNGWPSLLRLYDKRDILFQGSGLEKYWACVWSTTKNINDIWRLMPILRERNWTGFGALDGWNHCHPIQITKRILVSAKVSEETIEFTEFLGFATSNYIMVVVTFIKNWLSKYDWLIAN